MTDFEKAFMQMTPEQRKETGEAISEMMGMPSMSKLLISGRKVDAVYFHLPDEPYGFLSNWYLSSFELDGIRFSSMEQYIMYNKCVEFGDTDSVKAVMATDVPAEQQKIARKAFGYNDKIWAGRRQLVALKGLMAKFSQNEDLKTKLLDTGDAYLVECAYQDVIWACGIRLNENERFDASNWRGTNILGFALMEVRDRLRKQFGQNVEKAERVDDKDLKKKNSLDARQDKIRGCLIGGAAGDALGYPVEFDNESKIFDKYGKSGITSYCINRITGNALISDDTQMTLFTATGLLIGDTRGKMRGIQAAPRHYVASSYQNWLSTQEMRYPEGQSRIKDVMGGRYSWLMDVPELYDRRAPGNTCLNALRAQKRQTEGRGFDSYVKTVQNDSKGCGGVMRVAPLALNYGNFHALDKLDMEGAEIAAITHSHSLGYMPAAVLTHIISRIVYPKEKMTLKEIVLEAEQTVLELFKDDKHVKELTDIIDLAVELSENGYDDLDNINRIGEGWVAEETLAIAIYCALRHQDDFSAGIIAAVNHKGDSDSTGAVTGNILGALLGYEALDEKWKKDLELKDVILEVADDLYNGCQISEYSTKEDPDWERKYIKMQWKEDEQESENTPENKPSKFELIHASCADQEVDVVVNAANSRLWEGGGICGVIFSRAGSRELTEACNQYQTPLRDGEAVITPSFNMKNAKAIIHAVGPNFGVTPTAFKELFNAYYNSLLVMKDNRYHSISFPLISSSIFGGNLPNPVAESTKQCLRAYKQFTKDYPDYAIDVKLCAYTDVEMQKAKQEYEKTN